MNPKMTRQQWLTAKPGLLFGLYAGMAVVVGLASVAMLQFVPAAYLLAGIGGGLMAVLVIAGVLRNPFAGLVLLIVLLPFHSFILMLLVGYLELPSVAGRLFQVWKESLVLFLLGFVLIKSNLKIRMRVRMLDYFILAFLALQAAYIFLPSEYTTWSSVLYGMRNNSMFFLVYFLGRLLPFNEEQATRLVSLAVVVAFVASAYAIVEIVILPADVLSRLGFVRYHQEFLGQSLPGEQRFMNLPPQLYSEFIVGGRWIMLRRASSIYVNSVIFSFAQLVALPVMLTLALRQQGPQSRFVVLAITTGGFILGITRSAMLGMFAAFAFIIAIAVLQGRISKRVILLLLVITLLVAAVGLRLGLQHLASNTLSLTDHSSRVHLNALQENLSLTWEQPWGYGLGVSGTASHRFSSGLGGGGESWYFQIILQMGLLGGLLFFGIVFSSITALWGAYKELDDRYLKAVALGLVASSIGFAVASNFLHTWDYIPVSFPFWLLVGVVLQQHDRTLRDQNSQRISTGNN